MCLDVNDYSFSVFSNKSFFDLRLSQPASLLQGLSERIWYLAEQLEEGKQIFKGIEPGTEEFG